MYQVCHSEKQIMENSKCIVEWMSGTAASWKNRKTMSEAGEGKEDTRKKLRKLSREINLSYDKLLSWGGCGIFNITQLKTKHNFVPSYCDISQIKNHFLALNRKNHNSSDAPRPLFSLSIIPWHTKFEDIFGKSNALNVNISKLGRKFMADAERERHQLQILKGE